MLPFKMNSILFSHGRTSRGRRHSTKKRSSDLPGSRVAVAGLVACLIAGAPAARAERWEPIAPADLAATESTTHPGADFEMLIDRQRITDDFERTVIDHYQRTKIFTQKGVEEAGKLAIEYAGSTTISGLAARVIKPDGSSAELRKSDFFVSDVARRFGRKWKKTSMVFPDLQSGDIVECRWSESLPDGLRNYWGYCQRTIPVRESRIAIEARDQVGLQLDSFNVVMAERGTKGNELFFRFAAQPPFEEEDYMVPWREVRGWTRVSYVVQSESEDSAWKRISGEVEADFRDKIRASKLIESKVAELLKGLETDGEKLARLYTFCQESITNYQFYESARIQESVKRRERRGDDFLSATRTLEAGGGFGNEVDFLFAALASAAGYQVRLMRNAGRDDIINVRISRGWTLLNRVCIGVFAEDKWRYFTPGDHIVPYGLLPWEDEGAVALVCARKAVQFERLPVSEPDVSLTSRVGRFRLEADGTLDGTVEETITGHSAVALKHEHWSQTEAECRTSIEKRITDRLSTAEVSDLTWQNLNDITFPIVVRYHLRVPAYAGEVGQRLMLAPSVFTNGVRPVFSAEKRAHPVMFPHAYSEHDDVEIVLPAGFVLDQASAPSPVGGEDAIIKSRYGVRFARKTQTLRYDRRLDVGTALVSGVLPESYPTLKSVFDAVHRSDGHTMMVKPAPAVAAPPVGAAPAAPSK